jgi:DNA-binding LytR/AlgR family response regulator
MIPSRSNQNIKVFIADDSLIVREHLVTMLDELPRIVIVGQAENVAEAINGILSHQWYPGTSAGCRDFRHPHARRQWD